MTRGVLRFDNQVCIVSGAASGIGKRTVELLRGHGASVAALDIKYSQDISRSSEELLRIRTDLRNSQACDAAIDEVIETWGRVDVLINVAGVTLRSPMLQTTDALLDEAISSNLKTTYYLSRAVLRSMTSGHGGAIVNTASINAIRGNRDLTAYSASKGAITALTRAMALEFSDVGVRVNCVCPGTVLTPMTDQFLSSVEDSSIEIDRLVAKHPLGRLATKDDVAWVLIALASSQFGFVTGACIPVDGGRHL